MLQMSLFSSDCVLSSDIIMCILLLLSLDDLLALKLVCKDWRLSLSDNHFREIQVCSWKNLFSSYAISCEFNKYYRQNFRVIEIDNPSDIFQSFKSLIDEEWFDKQQSFKLIDVQQGLLCFKFWDIEMMLRI